MSYILVQEGCSYCHGEDVAVHVVDTLAQAERLSEDLWDEHRQTFKIVEITAKDREYHR